MVRDLLKSAARIVRDLFRSRAALAAENELLRRQLLVLLRRTPKPRLRRWDRVVVAGLTKIFPKLLDAVVIVKPRTVLGWHRSMWRRSWWRRSGRPTGRPPIDADLRTLIRKMWRENLTWGEDRIASELEKLGHYVSARTVAKYRPPNIERGKGQKWSTFIRNHLHQAWACDWFTIVTWNFRVIYGWVMLDLGRRRIVDVGATSTPSAQYAAQRFVQAVVETGNRAPRLLIRDRDQIYGEEFKRRVRNCETRSLMGPPRAPQSNTFCERVIGTLRRDCLDHVLVRDEVHAERVLREYVGYYHGRPHRGLHMSDKDAEAYLIASNRHVELGGWDDAGLAALLQDVELEGTGFSQDDLLELLDRVSAPTPLNGDPDDTPEPKDDADVYVRPGELYLLGNHRLLCGDSTKPEDVAKVMDGKTADLCWTDPPWNVAYGKSDHPSSLSSRGPLRRGHCRNARGLFYSGEEAQSHCCEAPAAGEGGPVAIRRPVNYTRSQRKAVQPSEAIVFRLLWVAALLWPALANAAGKKRVLVVNVSSSELDAATGLSKLVQAEIENDGRLSVAGTKQAPVACRADPACMMGLAKEAQAELVLVASLTTEGKGFVLTMTLGAPGAVAPASQSESMRALKSVGLNVPLCLAPLLHGVDFSASAAEPPPPPPVEPEPVAAPPPAAPATETAWVRPASTAPKSERKRVMVLEVKAVGLESAMLERLPGDMAAVIAKQPGYDVASADEVKQLLVLDKTRQLTGCESDAACITEITKKLNADLIVNGSLGQLGTSLVLTLVLIDSREAGTSRRASDTFESEAALQAGLAGTLGKLFGWAGQGTVAQYRLPKGKKTSFAIFDLSATGVAPEIGKNLTQVLSSEVKNIEGTSVVSRDDIMALLQFDKQKSEMGCTEDTACMANIGGALGVDRLVVGSVGKVAEEFIISLRLVDARKAMVENRHTESFKGGEDQLIGATRQAARALLGLEVPGTGRLAVTSSHPAADVFIDSEKAGRLPLPPIEQLKPGRHNVRLVKDGFFDWQSDLYVSPVETTVAWAPLKERPERWYQKWWVWTIAGVVVAGGTTAAVVLTQRPKATGTVDLP